MSQYPDNHEHDPQPYNRLPNHEDIRLQEERLRLAQEEQRISTVQRISTIQWINNGIYFLVGALEVLLLLRLFLRLSGANPNNTFAQTIYGLSDPFMAPFATLFVSPTSGGGSNVFDLNLLVAIIVYAVLGMLATWLVRTIGSRR